MTPISHSGRLFPIYLVLFMKLIKTLVPYSSNRYFISLRSVFFIASRNFSWSFST